MSLAALPVAVGCGSDEGESSTTDATAGSGAGAGGSAGGPSGGGGSDGGGSSTGGAGGEAPAPCTLTLAARGRHTCAIKDAAGGAGTVWCWGWNAHGQIGNGAVTAGEGTPVEVTSLGSSVVDVGVGDDFTCAAKSDGTVWCWGNNQYGQLGSASDDTNLCEGAPCSPTPTQVPLPAVTAVQVVTGADFACARTSQGGIWCWGRDNTGQMGKGAAGVDSPPVEVSMPDGTSIEASDLAAGASHACAIQSNASAALLCWGYNGQGQLGIGTTSLSEPPATTNLGGAAARVAGGMHHTCAIRSDGALYCWGSNEEGTLGDGTMQGQTCSSWLCKPTPVQVQGVAAPASAVGAGAKHTCAVGGAENKLWCWGYSGDGLGTGAELGQQCQAAKCVPTPTETLLHADVAGVTGGYFHTCARKTDGTVWCWGWNEDGALGIGTMVAEDELSPVEALICP